VRLSNLVGQGGLWYGFGKTIMDMYVTYKHSGALGVFNSSSLSLSDEQANEMSEMLSKVRPISPNGGLFILMERRQAFRERLLEVIDQAQHFAALGQTGPGGSSADTAQSFREGLDTTERECMYLVVAGKGII